MSNGFGIEMPAPHEGGALRARARYLVVIDSGGSTVARLFLASREQVAEFDAGTEEVVQMVRHLEPGNTAADPAWDRALAGHSAEERSAARVYVLDI